MAMQPLGAEKPRVEQVSGPLVPSMPGLEQMTREGRKEGRKGTLHPAPILPPCPDIIPSGNLLTQAPCEPLHPHPSPTTARASLVQPRESRLEVSQGPGTQPSGAASEATRGQSRADVSPASLYLSLGEGDDVILFYGEGNPGSQRSSGYPRSHSLDED